MRVFRVKCRRCGLQATRYGEGARSVTSVNAEEQGQLCQMVAEAQARGEPSDALSVDCEFLRAAEVVDGESVRTLS